MRIRAVGFFLLLAGLNFSVYAQSKNIKLPENWYNLDNVESGYFGISTDKAYQELLKSKKPKQKVIVAVIDGGVDTNHEDLKSVLWTNKKEIPGNGIDDDGNGYIDDIHGWNFIGSKNGNLQYENLEMVRLLRILKPKYQSTTNLTPLDSASKIEYAQYKKLIADFGTKYEEASKALPIYLAISKVLDSVAFLNKVKVPTLENIDQFNTDDEMEQQVVSIIKKGSKEAGFDKFYKDIKDGVEQLSDMVNYNLNPKYDKRALLVGDNYADSYERNYGNNDVAGPDAKHGSHVSGIIAADRNNNLGIKGVANNVSIMAIRVVPTGDERDKDVANGIRYAVDNGAKVINMSFGKGYKWDKKVVDDAVKYAEEKGVLLVHAAGNDNLNNDTADVYPNKYYEGIEADAYKLANKKPVKPNFIPTKLNNNMGPQRFGGSKIKTLPLDSNKYNLPHAKNYITVGASAYKDDELLKADFSNYGKHTVDVFAPGFMINSTVPGSKYDQYDGTSMAAPVVSGLAALILTYYPKLSPAQVRDILIKSVSKVDHKIKYKNDKGDNIRVPFADICISGGIVNAYNALKLAENYKK